MTNARPAARPKTAETWQWRLDPSDAMPAGRVLVTLAPPERARGLRDPIHAVYIVIPERGERATRTRAFDGGSAVVEYDDEGNFLGIELLSLRKPQRLPQLFREVRRSRSQVLRVAFWTAHHIWHDVRFALQLLAQEGRKRPGAGSVLKAHPDNRTWQDPRDAALAVGG